MIDAPDTLFETIARLGAAAALGAAIGWDREIKGRAAGLRTHMLVALGAAAFIVTGLQIIEGMAAAESVQFDLTRIVQGVAGGVGFLGAGAIIQSGGKVRGLTTAAGMWTCAGMGVAAGAGLYITAAVVTGLCLLILTIVSWVEPRQKGGQQPDEALEGRPRTDGDA